MPKSERRNLATLNQLPITTPSGEVLPLLSVATIDSRRGINFINHRNALQAVNIYAHVDTQINTSMAIIEEVEKNIIPQITDTYRVTYGLGQGSAEKTFYIGARTARYLCLKKRFVIISIFIMKNPSHFDGQNQVPSTPLIQKNSSLSAIYSVDCPQQCPESA